MPALKSERKFYWPGCRNKRNVYGSMRMDDAATKEQQLLNVFGEELAGRGLFEVWRWSVET